MSQLTLDTATPVPAITRTGRVVHLGVQRPPFRSLCAQPLHDHWPAWYVLAHSTTLPNCKRCARLADAA